MVYDIALPWKTLAKASDFGGSQTSCCWGQKSSGTRWWITGMLKEKMLTWQTGEKPMAFAISFAWSWLLDVAGTWDGRQWCHLLFLRMKKSPLSSESSGTMFNSQLSHIWNDDQKWLVLSNQLVIMGGVWTLSYLENQLLDHPHCHFQ